jgi:hypothetical protein
MSLRRSCAAAALALALSIPLAALSQDEETIAGPIQRIEDDGRLRVQGFRIRADGDTDVRDQLNRPATVGELTEGIAVEVTYEETSTGPYAKKIVATMLR